MIRKWFVETGDKLNVGVGKGRKLVTSRFLAWGTEMWS